MQNDIKKQGSLSQKSLQSSNKSNSTKGGGGAGADSNTKNLNQKNKIGQQNYADRGEHDGELSQIMKPNSKNLTSLRQNGQLRHLGGNFQLPNGSNGSSNHQS